MSHNPSEIIVRLARFATKETFNVIISVVNSYAILYLMSPCWINALIIKNNYNNLLSPDLVALDKSADYRHC